MSASCPCPPPAPGAAHLNLAVVGCGRMFRNCHGPAVRELQRQGWPVSIGALCDPDPQARAAAGSLFPDAAAHADHRGLLAGGRPDAILIQCWPPHGAAIARWAIAQGIPCLIEKPVAHDLATLADLARTATAAGVRVMVGYNRRFQAGAEDFRRIVAGMSGGRSFAIRLLRERRSESLFYEDVLGHPLDFMRSVVGDLAVTSISRGTPPRPGDIAPWLRVAASCALGDCSFELRPAVGRNLESYECLAGEAAAQLVYHPLEHLADPAACVSFTPGRREDLLAGRPGSPLHIQGFVGQMACFLGLVAGRSEGPVCTLDGALATLRLVRAILDAEPGRAAAAAGSAPAPVAESALPILQGCRS